MKGKFHYAWMIVFVTFLAFLAVQGGRLAFGAFVEPWEQDLHMDRATTSLISTISFVIYGLSQPFIGRFIDRYGARLILSISTFIVGISFFFITFVTQPWQLFILYSLVSVGVGGASNVAGTVLITNWFNKKRGLALGIMEAGFGFGQMLLVPGSLMLIHWFDWRTTIFILGALLIVIVFPVVLFFLRNHPNEKAMEPLGGKINEKEESGTEHEKKPVSLKVLFKMREFWFLMVPFAVCGFTTTGLMDTHLIPLSHHHGFSATVTGTAVSILAACNIVGILLSGVIIDYWSSRKLLVFIYFTRALSIGILVYSHNTVLLLLFASIFGFVDFATVAPTQLLVTQYFKNYSIGFIVGCLSLSHQIGSALGAFIPGLLYSNYGNYELSLYISILLVLAAAIMNLLLPEPKRMKIVVNRAN
ncbi:MFS transporter [Bacillus timonensis]|uniref:MFS transporter n=1 Tax=Bacillus timonensis TaxID=1033734 RepID=A0A4S3PQ20_9BACI|nr:MFS transporter [Bacillus timonensis]THE11731.1 MFS transporter [Bacillus timonensis]